jgi:hypothetical protein
MSKKLTTKLPSWDDARQLLDLFKGHALMTVAAKVCLGMTLQALKEKEGYTHGGNRHSAEGKITWPELLQKELGISEPTARRFIESGLAVKAKIAKIGGSTKLLGLLDKPVQTLSQADAKTLQDAIRTATDGESITSLLQEFRLIKCPPPAPDHSAGGSAKRTKPSELQLAWDFAGGSVITELSKLRSGSNFKHALHTLPLSATDEVPFGLVDYVAELRATYEEAEAVLKTRMKS